jgi:hypothetical protein
VAQDVSESPNGGKCLRIGAMNGMDVEVYLKHDDRFSG